MEIVASCSIGVLAAVAVAGLLPGAAPAARAGRARAADPVAAARAIATSLARALRLERVGDARWRAAVADEVRAVSLGRAQPCAAWDERAALGAVAAAALAGLVVGLILAPPLGAASGAAVPVVAAASGAHRRMRTERARIDRAMPEAFSALAISLGSGFSLAQALGYVGSHAEEPVRSAFLRASCTVSCGTPAVEALDGMIAELKAPGLGLVTLALEVSQRTGAPLKDLLAEAAEVVGTQIELARRLDVKTSQARLSARVVALMPLAMIGFLTLFSTDFQRGMATAAGAASLAVALVLNGAAWLAIRRIMAVEL